MVACSPSAPASRWVAKGLACKWGRALPIFWESYSVATKMTAGCFWLPARGLVRAAAGATAVVQPGGSMRDAEVVAAADEHGIAMVFTGRRHFRH